MFILCILTLLHLPGCSLFEVNRLEGGDILSGSGISTFCGSASNCQCLSGETLIANSNVDKCITKINECELSADDGTNIHNIFLVLNDINANGYNVIVTTGSTTPVCVANTTTIVARPIFVRDLQTSSMFWNPNWVLKFQSFVKASLYETDKIQLTFQKHWSGLFIKFYIECDGQDAGCLGIKFDGMRSYPLTEDIVDEVLGPTPSPSLTVTSSMTSLPVISSTPSSISMTTNIQPSTTAITTESSSILQTPTSSILTTTSMSSYTSQSLSTSVNIEPTSYVNIQSTVIQSSRSTTSPQSSVITNTGAIKTEDTGDDIGLYVGIAVAIFLILLIIIIIICICKRKKQKKHLVNKSDEIEQAKPRPHASIRYMNSDTSNSITSPVAVLNKSRASQDDNKTNPLFEEHQTEMRKVSPKVTVERIRRNSKPDSIRSNKFPTNPTYDNPGYARDDFYGTDEPPSFRTVDDETDDDYEEEHSFQKQPLDDDDDDDQILSYRGFQQPQAQEFNKSFYGTNEPFGKLSTHDGLDDIPFEEDEDEDTAPEFHFGNVERVQRHGLEPIKESPNSPDHFGLI